MPDYASDPSPGPIRPQKITRSIPKARIFTRSGTIVARDVKLADYGVWFIRDVFDDKDEIRERGVGEIRPWASIHAIRIGWGNGQ